MVLCRSGRLAQGGIGRSRSTDQRRRLSAAKDIRDQSDLSGIALPFGILPAAHPGPLPVLTIVPRFCHSPSGRP